MGGLVGHVTFPHIPRILVHDEQQGQSVFVRLASSLPRNEQRNLRIFCIIKQGFIMMYTALVEIKRFIH